MRYENIMYSESGMFMFPIVVNIPFLLKNNAIIVSKVNNLFMNNTYQSIRISGTCEKGVKYESTINSI